MSGNYATITLQSSPLILLLARLYSRYPELDPEMVDRAVMDSKCNRDEAERILDDAILAVSPQGGRRRTESLNDWYASDAVVSSSKPNAVIKVYRLDGDHESAKR